MTGRRAVRQWDERLSRALQFRPGHVGGRIPSAQPVRRRGGTVRSASVGAVAEPTLPSWVQSDFDRFGFGVADVEDQFGFGVPAIGDLIVSVLVGGNAPVFTPPAGWTELTSGVGTALGYWAGWAIFPADYVEDDWEFTFTGGGEITAASWAYRGGNATPAAVVTEVPSATSVNLPSGGAWALVACADDGVTFDPPDFAAPGNPGTAVNVATDLTLGFGYVADVDGYYVPSPITGGTATHASAREWITVQIGWAA